MTQRLFPRHDHTGDLGFDMCILGGYKRELGNLYCASECQCHMPRRTDLLLYYVSVLGLFYSSLLLVGKCLTRNNAGCCPHKCVSFLSRSLSLGPYSCLPYDSCKPSNKFFLLRCIQLWWFEKWVP